MSQGGTRSGYAENLPRGQHVMSFTLRGRSYERPHNVRSVISRLENPVAFLEELTMQSRRLRSGAAVALLVGVVGLALVSPAFGQGAGASIEGVAKDQQGGVLPGVIVTLRNQDSGVTRTSTTETDGRYRFLALPPGRYHLSAELSGFASKDVGDISTTI